MSWSAWAYCVTSPLKCASISLAPVSGAHSASASIRSIRAGGVPGDRKATDIHAQQWRTQHRQGGSLQSAHQLYDGSKHSWRASNRGW